MIRCECAYAMVSTTATTRCRSDSRASSVFFSEIDSASDLPETRRMA
jgi:hypothetical protein